MHVTDGKSGHWPNLGDRLPISSHEVQKGSSDWFLDGEVDRTDEKAKHAALHKKYSMLTQRTRDACWKGMMVQSLIK